MKYSLRAKLSFSYALMALLLVAIISVCINILFQSQFKNYIISQQKQKNTDFVSLIQKQYHTAEGSWNSSALEDIGVSALEQGIILKITDSKGNMVWDATVHNNGMCVQMLEHMAEKMRSYSPSFKGGYEQSEYPVSDSTGVVGWVTVGYYGPYYYTDNDIHFLNRVNIILVAVGVISLIMAFLLGAYIASRLFRPVSQAAEAAVEISRGNFKQRIAYKSNTTEMIKLTDTINNLADSLERQESLRKQMSADVAHELRTPLANLQSSLEAMIDGVWQPSSERLESCHEEILRINRLVGDLEKLERFESENAVLTIDKFDISQQIGHVIQNFENEFHKKNITLQYSGDSKTIEADRDKISQVFINLISNALKYTPEGGRVLVCLKDMGDLVEIDVEDNGVGIAQEDLPYVFERFYRADRSRNRLTGGSGLGLSIAKAIVMSHGGEIRVESTVGKGTVIKVWLPDATES